MLKPSRIALASPPGPGPLLQAALEALVGLLLEGRIQSGMITGRWGEESLLLGYYEPYHGQKILVRRRITGGHRILLEPDSGYTGIVFASESLQETVELAESIARCSHAREWGATRMGPRKLGAGIIEVMGHPDPEAPLNCLEEALDTRLERHTVNVQESAERIARAYQAPSWAHYTGAESLPHKARVNRCNYWLRIGLSLAEGKYIAEARVDGAFHAAPPNEPFNLASNLRGLPLNEQALLATEARLEWVELHGIRKSDILQAFEGLVRSLI